MLLPRANISKRQVEVLRLIAILLQDAVILLAGFLAEFAYEHLFEPNLPSALGIAKDAQEPANVRFYAACRVADLLHEHPEMIEHTVASTERSALIRPPRSFARTPRRRARPSGPAGV